MSDPMSLSSSSSITLKKGAAAAISSSMFRMDFRVDFYHLSLAFVFFMKLYLLNIFYRN